MKLGSQNISFKEKEVKGSLVDIKGESYYKISNVDAMRPFFMSIVSAYNHWMFISSNGGLTAGRKNSDHALFPYYTDDKITRNADSTGSKTIIKATIENETYLWEPFSDRYEGIYKITRNLYKNKYGNKVLFEEINHDLNLTIKYSWNSSDQFGFVRISELLNHNETAIQCEILDGLQDLLPANVGEDLQKASSNLVDAYKRSELHADSGIGLLTLSAVIVDKAEPSESLMANICWSLGLDNATYLLSNRQVNDFRKGKSLFNEYDIKAEKGAYFNGSIIDLEANESKEWMFIADVDKTIGDVHEIAQQIESDKNLYQNILASIEKGTEQLIALTAASDGIQLTEDPLINNRHFANTMFNIMRGGIFDEGYNIEKLDFKSYLEEANKQVYASLKEQIEKLPSVFTLFDLQQFVDESSDIDLKRLCLEYLPLKFSRRHGDPSRPWNKFSINTRDEVDGSKILDYQGNWRDIFQNWEALAHSYPEFMEGMIHKFLNATTFDGYNPYRVTKGGFDWETIEEDDPWSYIGYWGDHQIIYLLKFLEFQENYHPGELISYFSQELFVYANVPYVIKPYQDICKNPKDTIDFDHKAQEYIENQRLEIGVDGALLKSQNETIYKVNFLEKLLATVLAKMSNFIPEAGIWLNTQRPEWNDANNALVGNGVSMVTLYYLRRFLNFTHKILDQSVEVAYSFSQEFVVYFESLLTTLNNYENVLNGAIDNKTRKSILDELGIAASEYRHLIYNQRFSGNKTEVKTDTVKRFVQISLKYLDHSIVANKRKDNLYHAYNLMTIKGDEIEISYLSEMLEGQVAVLSSGYLNAHESLDVLNALKQSSLFRVDQYSYILYPNKELKGFTDKNIIPKHLVESSQLLQKLVENNNKQIITQDVIGDYHFSGQFNNVDSLRNSNKELDESYSPLIHQESSLLEEIFEEVFNHKEFTGRSGTFFGYEGLGSIYWHMVSKLLLAIQETVLAAIKENIDPKTIGLLLDHYYEVQAGIGVHKTPQLYGAFPTDPYSHTPATKGAQQPGMTGQVKEDILCRIGELGIIVTDGKIQFEPKLLRAAEFLTSSTEFKYLDVSQEAQSIAISKNSLAFTYCQVPVIYHKSKENIIRLHLSDGNVIEHGERQLTAQYSSEIFKRSGLVKMIEVHVFEDLK